MTVYCQIGYDTLLGALRPFNTLGTTEGRATCNGENSDLDSYLILSPMFTQIRSEGHPKASSYYPIKSRKSWELKRDIVEQGIPWQSMKLQLQNWIGMLVQIVGCSLGHWAFLSPDSRVTRRALIVQPMSPQILIYWALKRLLIAEVHIIKWLNGSGCPPGWQMTVITLGSNSLRLTCSRRVPLPGTECDGRNTCLLAFNFRSTE